MDVPVLVTRCLCLKSHTKRQGSTALRGAEPRARRVVLVEVLRGSGGAVLRCEHVARAVSLGNLESFLRAPLLADTCPRACDSLWSLLKEFLHESSRSTRRSPLKIRIFNEPLVSDSHCPGCVSWRLRTNSTLPHFFFVKVNSDPVNGGFWTNLAFFPVKVDSDPEVDCACTRDKVFTWRSRRGFFEVLQVFFFFSPSGWT